MHKISYILGINYFNEPILAEYMPHDMIHMADIFPDQYHSGSSSNVP